MCTKLKTHSSGTIFKFFCVKFNCGLHLDETISKNCDKQSKKKNFSTLVVVPEKYRIRLLNPNYH